MWRGSGLHTVISMFCVGSLLDNPCQVPPATVRPCNTMPCPETITAWAVGPWTSCSAVQDRWRPCTIPVGIQQRRVTCQSADGTLMPDDTCSSMSPAPPSMQTCSLPLSSLCACQRDEDCTSTNTVCNATSAQCVCGAGWGGDACSVPLLLLRGGASQGNCSSGVVDAAGDCCEGYVDATTGLCCPSGAPVDSVGVCCPQGRLDACGVCNGDGVAVGRDGVCCRSPLPPSGICCVGGQVDSCGVCGGDNHCR
jgi:hypothetical protein